MENTNKLDVATKNIIGQIQIKNTATITSREDVKVAKVLSATAQAKVESATVMNGEVKFDGKVEYDFLVVLEDGNISSINEISKFSQNYNNDKIMENNIVNIESNLIELNSVNLTPNEFSYTSTINFDFYRININREIESVNVAPDIFTKENEISFYNLLTCVDYETSISFDLQKDSKLNKILLVKNCATIKSVVPAIDYFVVSGEVYSFIVYQTEEGQIKYMSKSNTFSEEIEAKGVVKESNIQARIGTKKTIINTNNEGNRFEIEIPLEIKAQIYNCKTEKCIVDAYSLSNEINLTTQALEKNEFLNTKQVEDNIISTFALSNLTSKIDRILSVVPNNITVVNQIIKEGELLLEGIASINIIYYTEDDDDNDVLNSIDVEVPYSLNIKAPELNKNDNVSSDIVFGDINIKNRHGNELEILAEVRINYNVYKESIIPITTQIQYGDKKALKEYALEIYLAKSNQTLWDIAKELNISVDDLILQNGELPSPLEDGQKIVAYSQRQIEFN